MIKKLIGSAAKIRQGRAWHCGVERKVHHWRELAKVTKEQAGATTKQCVGVMRKHLTKTLIHLAKNLSSHHGHFVND